MSETILPSQTKAPGNLQAESPLSPHRAFVVQFRAETKVARGRYAGRVEHVVSGRMTHFASLEELLAFIGQVLATVGTSPGRKGKRGG